MSDSHARLRAERKTRRARIKRLREHVAAQRLRIRKISTWLNAHPGVPPINNGWHPDAVRNQVQAGGTYLASGHPRLTWHTTEGSSLPTYSGSHPHFTLDVKGRRLYQHIPIERSAMALRNLSGGVETNRINKNVQVELIAFSDANFAKRAGKSQYAVVNLTDDDYAQIARLARWIEKHAGVPRKCGVTFRDDSNHKVSHAEWATYEGHIGHQHVPENDHWDPSGSFKIGRVLA